MFLKFDGFVPVIQWRWWEVIALVPYLPFVLLDLVFDREETT